MQILEDKGRFYKRKRPSPDEKIMLANEGLQYTLSSNVSAVGTDGDDLIIRFHNGSLYSYTNRAHLIDDILRSSSKGHWVFAHLRRNNAKFKKIGSLPLKSDIALTDEEIFGTIDEVQKSIDALVGDSTTIKNSMFTGVLLGQTIPTYTNPLMDAAMVSVIKTMFTPLI